MSKQDELELLSKPGDTILEILESQQDFHYKVPEEIDFTLEQFLNLISGIQRIDDTLAIKLEKVFKIDHRFWLERERIYREKLNLLNQ